MTNTNVKNYTDKQIIERFKSLKSFKFVPQNYHIINIRSIEDGSDIFDDKSYLFFGEKCIMVTSCTTNPGKKGLLGYKEYNSQGCAVVKADEIYYDLWANGLHKGKMQALVQINDILYYRDNNNNLKSEEIGKIFKGKIGINFHTATYEKRKNVLAKFIAWIIGGWSLGCQVLNIAKDYYEIIDYVKNQKTITFCLLNEF